MWLLSEGESEALGKALINLEKQYPTRIDPRMLAWLNFIGVCGAVYGTRIGAMVMEAKARTKRPNANAAKPAGIPDNPPQPRPADVTPPGGPTQPAGTTYRHVPPGMVDMEALRQAQSQMGQNAGGPN